MLNARIDFSNPMKLFESGQKVEGQLVIDFKDPTIITAIECEAYGELYTKKLKEPVSLFSKKKLYCPDKKCILMSGQHTEKVLFQLPEFCPPSFKFGTSSGIQYGIRIRVYTQSKVHHFAQKFRVYNPTPSPNMVITPIETVATQVGNGTIKMTVELPRVSYSLVDVLEAKLRVENNSNRTVDGLKWKLIDHAVFAEGTTVNNTARKQEIHLKIRPMEVHEFKQKIILRSQVTSFEYPGMVKMNHTLKFVLSIGRLFVPIKLEASFDVHLRVDSMKAKLTSNQHPNEAEGN